MVGRRSTAARRGITFHHPAAFWLGSGAVTVGVLLHLPMYTGARDMGYHLAGMPVDGPMMVGMALVLVGLAATFYGLLPSLSATPKAASTLRIRALDDAKLSPAHIGLLVVMAIAVTIDVMKPLDAELRGSRRRPEYGLKSALNPGGSVPVAFLPLAGLTGTVLGSIIWGWLGDRVGRRASILLAGVCSSPHPSAARCPTTGGTSSCAS